MESGLCTFFVEGSVGLDPACTHVRGGFAVLCQSVYALPGAIFSAPALLGVS